MGAIYREWSDSNNPAILAQYIASLDSRLTQTTFTSPYDITIDTNNIGSVFFRIDDTTISLYANNVVIDTRSWGGLGGNYGVESIIGANFIILRIHRPESAGPRWNEIYFLSQDNSYYAGGKNGTTYGRKFAINEIRFYKSDGTGDGYYFPILLNFSSTSGTIAYSDISPMCHSSGYVNQFFQSIKPCSTTLSGSTIALSNGNNYYTISTNHMVELSS